MKNLVILSIALLLALLAAGPSHAQESLLGIKTGSMMIDFLDIDDVVPVGLMYGRSLDDLVSNLWIEGELNYGISGGDLGASGEFDIMTIGVYAAYRYMLTDAAYLKGKAGILYEDTEIDFGRRTASPSDTGLSLGVGGGFFFTPQLGVEAEYTLIESDIDYLSVGLNFRF